MIQIKGEFCVSKIYLIWVYLVFDTYMIIIFWSLLAFWIKEISQFLQRLLRPRNICTKCRIKKIPFLSDSLLVTLPGSVNPLLGWGLPMGVSYPRLASINPGMSTEENQSLSHENTGIFQQIYFTIIWITVRAYQLGYD